MNLAIDIGNSSVKYGVFKQDKLTLAGVIQGVDFSKLNEIISANKMNDPEEIKIIEDQIEVILEGANRWTDNTWAVKKYLTKKKGMSPKDVSKYHV